MKQPQPAFFPAPVGALLSVIPGLGQLASGRWTRGILIMFCLISLYGLIYWRLVDAELEVSLFPPSIESDNLSNPQETAITYALLALVFTTLAYIWNIFDGFACAEGRPSPARMGTAYIIIATLIVGSHITQVDIGKAVREVDDIVPRLSQILWPWNPDKILEHELEDTSGIAHWQTPCQEAPVEQPAPVEDQPTLSISPDCGEPSGNRQPNGTRKEGTTITISGDDFEPGREAEIIIKPASIPEFRVVVDGERVKVIPDDSGHFEYQFVMPNFTIPMTTVGAVDVEIIVRQQREVGTARLVDEFWLSFEGIVETIFLALVATAAGLVLAVPSSFISARNLMNFNPVARAIYYLVRLVMNVIRSIEPIIWALIAIVWVGPGPFAGVIALAIHTVASLGKLYSEAIEGIDNGPIEAIQATGATRLQTVMYAVVPQIIPPFVSFTIYRWDINVRMSTIIGAVGGGGIGAILVQWIRLADYDSVGIAVWMIAIVVTILDYASARIREHYI